ncbi:hypothetical protein [Streptomyces sp. NPDC026589]
MAEPLLNRAVVEVLTFRDESLQWQVHHGSGDRARTKASAS